ncbi:uncharacterized protein LOC18444611 isoform X2 [Amborella trichopoda]|uniref:uncharacterized protein LOC18444611 isoform X2 n=1 Tax=Amborella trichopoda TaxID=13333 RepID=UPI0009BDBBF1|nr:uncharacterized protein LOC18444611 isoform X2 [Amborella trichopoda]|eukprot:XP_020529475.1 uncharacterized protein LOC18444611 isoform X2 [Amborella trichopoda]
MLKENGDFMGSFTDFLGGVVRKGVPKAEDLMREGKERANLVASAVRESMPKAEELVKEGMARANLVASAVRDAMPIAHEKVADLPREGKVKSQLLADQGTRSQV